VKALEEAGVGRPSTYADIMKVNKKRGYITGTGGGGERTQSDHAKRRIPFTPLLHFVAPRHL
jgi:DNA topoisomerase IA